MFSKADITVSRGRSSDRVREGAHSWPSPIVPKLPSRGNFGDDRHVANGTESRFPKFPKIKYLGGDSVSGKAVHVWHFFSKNLFSENNLPDLDSSVQIKNRDTNWVRTVARRPHAGPSTACPSRPGFSWLAWRTAYSTFLFGSSASSTMIRFARQRE